VDEQPKTFDDLFGYLATPAAPETLAAEYIVREYHSQRPLAEIVEDEFLTEKFSPEELDTLLDRWDVAGVIGEETVARYRNPELFEEAEEAAEGEEGDGLDEGDEDEFDEEDDADEEEEDEDAEPADPTDAWAAEWAGVDLPEDEPADDDDELDEDEDADEESDLDDEDEPQ
jgi:hypothetical protein